MMYEEINEVYDETIKLDSALVDAYYKNYIYNHYIRN